jgi:hypothetical protein
VIAACAGATDYETTTSGTDHSTKPHPRKARINLRSVPAKRSLDESPARHCPVGAPVAESVALPPAWPWIAAMPHRKKFLLSDLDRRAQTDMDVVLELVCRELEQGGRHKERKYIAERLIECAGSGQTTLGDLQIVARRALLDLQNKKSA